MSRHTLSLASEWGRECDTGLLLLQRTHDQGTAFIFVNKPQSQKKKAARQLQASNSYFFATQLSGFTGNFSISAELCWQLSWSKSPYFQVWTLQAVHRVVFLRSRLQHCRVGSYFRSRKKNNFKLGARTLLRLENNANLKTDIQSAENKRFWAREFTLSKAAVFPSFPLWSERSHALHSPPSMSLKRTSRVRKRSGEKNSSKRFAQSRPSERGHTLIAAAVDRMTSEWTSSRIGSSRRHLEQQEKLVSVAIHFQETQ